MRSTVAPLVMSVCASVSWVASLPRAFWTMMSELGSPAAVSAFVMSGWSNSTYRVELTVSGMIAATLPLPDLAKLLSCFMAEKLLVNDFVVNFGVPAAEADGPSGRPQPWLRRPSG